MSAADSSNWSKGRLEAVSYCPACGSDARTSKEWQRHDNDGQFPDRWRFVECARCRSLYLDPRPSPGSIGDAYATYYTHETSGGTVTSAIGRRLLPLVQGYLQLRFGLNRQPAWQLLASVFFLIEPLRLKLDYYGRHLPRRPATVFDVGCGNGDFLLRARGMGWEVGGCDPDPAAVALARSNGLNVICGFPEQVLPNQKAWDVITLGHVIEHVPEPLTTLRHCYDALRAGGHLWLATPNPTSVGFLCLRQYWTPLHPPYHFCILHPSQLKKSLELAGFTSVRFMRRGSQSSTEWMQAVEIARREGAKVPGWKVRLTRWWSEWRSTLHPTGADELIVIAYKP